MWQSQYSRLNPISVFAEVLPFFHISFSVLVRISVVITWKKSIVQELQGVILNPFQPHRSHLSFSLALLPI